MAKRADKRTETPAAIAQPAAAVDRGDLMQVVFVRTHKHDGVQHAIGDRPWVSRASAQLLEDLGAAYIGRPSS